MALSKIVDKIFRGYNGNDKVEVDKKVNEIVKVFRENFNGALNSPFVLNQEEMSRIRSEDKDATPSTKQHQKFFKSKCVVDRRTARPSLSSSTWYWC